MSIKDAINITVASGIALTVMLFLPFSLLTRERRPGARDEARPRASTRARPMTPGSVRVTGLVMAIFAGVMVVVVVAMGYLWFLGLAAYCCLWFGTMCGNISPFPQRFHKSLRLLVVGSLLLAVAFGLAWAGFCRWLDMPLWSFVALGGSAAGVFLYVAAKHIP